MAFLRPMQYWTTNCSRHLQHAMTGFQLSDRHISMHGATHHDVCVGIMLVECFQCF